MGPAPVSAWRLVEQMRAEGWAGEPLDVVRFPDGTVVTLENRRLAAAQKVGLTDIPTLVHDPNEPIPAVSARNYMLLRPVRRLPDGSLVAGGASGKVVFVRGRRPDTYGEAALFRAANQPGPTGEPIPLPAGFHRPGGGR
jgi:hypothetical protein